MTPLQTAFHKHHPVQCWFCASGMLTTAHALLSEEPTPTRRIRCCLAIYAVATGYIPIIEAVPEARAAYRKTDKS